MYNSNKMCMKEFWKLENTWKNVRYDEENKDHKDTV